MRRMLMAAIVMAGILAVPGPVKLAVPPPGATFHGLNPARLADTRSNGVTVDGVGQGTGAILGGTSRTVQVLGRGGVPASGVGAVALNVTAISPTAASFLTIFPAGSSRPNASNLNLAPGRTLPNMVIVPVGDGGLISVYNDRGSTHVAVDVLGWFPTFFAFTGLTPARLADTRPTGSTVDGSGAATGALSAGSTRAVTVVGRGGVPASGVGAVALNVTAIGPSAASFVTVYPTGADRPNASNLNLAPGRTLPNMVIVPVGANGQVTLYNDQGSTHLAVDVLGWFPAGPAFSGLTPARLADTRTTGSTVDGLFAGTGTVGARGSLNVPVVGRGGVPASGVGAVALNVTAIGPSAASFVTVYPTGADRPNASNLNLAPGRTLPNMVIVPVGANGQVTLYNDQGSTHLAVDVLGWFPTSTQPASTIRVSRHTNGTPGNAVSGGIPDISADGRVVAFTSFANNLVPSDTNGLMDVFVHDVASGVTERVSVSSAGGQSNGVFFSGSPSISATGRFVAFQSDASNLVLGDNNTLFDIFVRDRQAGVTERVSVSSGGQEANGLSGEPSISADGRFVAFSSEASNLVLGDTNNGSDIFVHDRVTDQTTRVSVTSTGQQGNGLNTHSPSISADGRFVAFVSSSTDLVSGDTNGVDDVFVHDRVTGLTTRVSVATGGAPSNGVSRNPSISADGWHVAFDSAATNLVTGDTNGFDDVFVHDRRTVTTRRVSISSSGEQGNSNLGSSYPSVSADGRYVAFRSFASNLVVGDTNNAADDFVHDLTNGVTERVSVSSGGAQGTGGHAGWPAISADGRFVAFDSLATNLVAFDQNGVSDVFLRDRGTT